MKNLKLSQKIGTVLLAGSIILSSPTAVLAEKAPKHGSYILVGTEEAKPDAKFNIYIVKENDNLSRISEKICRKVYGIEPTTKYWPVLAFMNGYPRIAQPGDEISFPTTLAEMEARLTYLKKSGLYGQYVRANNIYKKKLTVQGLLNEIYGNAICVDPDFIATYLETLGLSDVYDANSVIQSTQDLWNLTVWIPSLPQMYGQDFWYYFSDAVFSDQDAWMINDPDSEITRTK